VTPRGVFILALIAAFFAGCAVVTEITQWAG
jgi:hypothetical protein